MSRCPSDDHLALLIDEELEASAESNVAAHVQVCLACQMRLDEITRGRLAGIIGLLPAAIGPDLRGDTPWRKAPAPDRTRALDDTSTELCSDDPTSVDPSSRQRPRAVGGSTLDPGSCCEDAGPTLDLEHDDFTGPARTADPPAGSGPAGPGDAGATTDHDPGADDGTEPGLDTTGRAGGNARDGLHDEFARIAGYEIQERLGQGGMGVVYKARQVGLNRLVAVKMIRGGTQARPEHFGRFRVEAEAVARLNHPNIIEIHDIGEAGGLPFVSLELLDGGDLGGRLAGTPQPGTSAAGLLLTLSKAIQVAHEAGIIHRDLKPANILFTADGVPKVTDFGLAKRLESDSKQTETGQIMGSPSYMAPEQARGHARDVGPAADVYALGAILYEMLTGRPPFKGETPIETIRQVVDDEVVPPSRLVPMVPRDLETIALKCLNKEPARRYESAGALAEDLGRFLDGRPIKARPASPWERGVKWGRRHPTAASLLGLAIASCLGLAVGGFLHERNKRIAEEQRNRVVQAHQDEGDRRIDRARAAISRRDEDASEKELTGVEIDLSTFRQTIQGEDRLRNLAGRLDDALGQVQARLAQVRSLAAQEAHNREDRARFQAFLALWDQTQLHAVGFGVAASDSPAKLGGSARKALAMYAKDPRRPETEWTLTDALPSALLEPERARVVDGCYDLLLLLSQAVEPAVGLQILDRAARLRPEPTAAYHLRRAECFARSGNRAGRDREEKLAAQRPPVRPLDHFLIGREHYRRWALAEAIASLDAAVRLDPDQTAAHLLLALCEYNVQPKRLNEARSSLSICIRAHPDLPGLYLLRALFYGEEGYQALTRIDPQRPDDEPGLRRQAAAAFEAAEADYASALQRHPDDDYRYALLVNRGGMALQAGWHDRSRADLEEAIRLKPGIYNAHAHLAQLDRSQGRLEAAYLGFSRAIERTSEPAALATLYSNRALLFADRKDLAPDRRAAAIRDLDEALRRQPKGSRQAADDHVSRARLLFGGGRHEEALAACAAAIRIVPDHAEAHRLRISALMVLKRYEEVLGSCDAYLAAREPTVEVLENRGLARLAREDYPGAIADFTRAVELRPRPAPEVEPRLLNRRGWTWHLVDAPRLALADFEASLQLIQDQSDALGGRGLARIRLGQWLPAVADAEAAVRLAVSSPAPDAEADPRTQVHFNAARIYAQAVEHAAREVGREGERAVALYRRYRARSLELLDRAFERIPDPARRRELLDDPALRPLRLAPGRPSSPRLSASAPGRPTG